MNSLLPPNATALERAAEAAMARLTEIPVPLRTLWNPATIALRDLSWLAWAVSIDNWDPAWPETVKRARVAQSLLVQRRKGTASAVRDVVSAYGGGIAIREWWQTSPRGVPHTFDLSIALAGVGGAAPPATFVEQVIDEVRRTKPARSHFTFTQALTAFGGIGVLAAMRPAVFTRLRLTAPAAGA